MQHQVLLVNCVLKAVTMRKLATFWFHAEDSINHLTEIVFYRLVSMGYHLYVCMGYHYVLFMFVILKTPLVRNGNNNVLISIS